MLAKILVSYAVAYYPGNKTLMGLSELAWARNSYRIRTVLA